MESIANESKSFPASRLIANTAVIIGAGWTAFIFLGMPLMYVAERIPAGTGFDPHWLFEFGNRFTIAITILTPIGVPGIACLYLGGRLQNHVSIKTVRAATATLTFMAMIMVGTVLVGQTTSSRGLIRASAEPWFFINAVIATLPLYTILYRQILKHDRIPISGYRDILTKPILIISAALVSLFALPVNMIVMQNVPFYNTPQIITLRLLPPIIVGCICYKMLVRWLGHNSQHPATVPPVAPAA